MPGPVSDSCPGPTDPPIRAEWMASLKRHGLRFFVLKAEEFLECLSEDEAYEFDELLKKYNASRRRRNKTPWNKYWVVNRDEPYADEVRKLIFDNEGSVDVEADCREMGG